MRIIFHIGMGKTGTTSIQQALRQNAADLSRQNIHYLGVWFDAISPEFRGVEGQRKFVSQGGEALASSAATFLKALQEKAQGDENAVFILSNENMFAAGPALHPFLAALGENGAELQLIAYLRDPHSWLPSAYTQWGIRHKTQPGPIVPYEKMARELIGQYGAIRFWLENYADRLSVRPFEKGIDVIQDFAETAAISLPPTKIRALERAEPAEILLRAMFNNRIPEPVLPERFDRLVVNTARKEVPSLAEMTQTCFRHDKTDEIIEEQHELFETIRDRVGIDYLDGAAGPERIPDAAELQARVIDYLLEITFDQAQRLKRLERLVNERHATEND